jgi:hypothetical protein
MKFTRIACSILAMLVLLGSASCASPAARSRIEQIVSSSVSSQPEEIDVMAKTVADYTPPSGFDADFGIQIPGLTLVGYRSKAGDTHIFVVQFLKGTQIDPQQMLEQMKQAIQDKNYTWFSVEMKRVEQKTVLMRGQEVALTTSAGQDSDGGAFYQAVAVFEGKGGPALVTVAGPAESWDAGMVEQFVSSFK